MKTKKILVVEDEPSMQKVLKEVLEGRAFHVDTASNGEDALAMIKKEKPDLVLLDIILPKKDGFEVLEEIKKNDETRELPVILLTNLSQAQDIERAMELGVTTYLIKSEYQLEDVVKKVEEALKK